MGARAGDAAAGHAGAGLARTLRGRCIAVSLGLLWAAAVLPAAAAVLVVGPGGQLAEALRRAVDGDEIHLLPGAYRGEVGVIERKRLTLRGVGARPVLYAEGRHAEGKATLVSRGAEVRIENIEFRGSRVPDGNGAGIRLESGRLHVVRCAFFDNENGILTSNAPDVELTVEDSEFGHAPQGGKLPHLLYAGRIARLTVLGSRFSGGQAGHLIKSRARHSEIRYNQLVDGPGGRAAYELEFPNGGIAIVVGNVIGQGEQTTNPTMLSFGAEGSDDRPQGLYVGNNTFVNEGLRPAYFIRVHEDKLPRAVAWTLQNNLFVGLGVGDARWSDVTRGNLVAAPVMLRDPGGWDFALADGSWLQGLGVDPAASAGTSAATGVDLVPRAQFTLPVGRSPIASRRRWDPGAHQNPE